VVTAAESVQESASDASNKSKLESGVRKNWLHSVDGFLASVLKVATAMITEMGKTAYWEYGITDDCREPPHEISQQPFWCGRLVMWPKGFQHSQFELTRFSVEHKLRKSRAEAIYRIGVSK